MRSDFSLNTTLSLYPVSFGILYNRRPSGLVGITTYTIPVNVRSREFESFLEKSQFVFGFRSGSLRTRVI